MNVGRRRQSDLRCAFFTTRTLARMPLAKMSTSMALEAGGRDFRFPGVTPASAGITAAGALACESQLTSGDSAASTGYKHRDVVEDLCTTAPTCTMLAWHHGSLPRHSCYLRCSVPSIQS